MSGFLSMDSPFMRFLTKVADLIILNILVIVCSIPIVTAGAAFTGMHYVLLKMVRNEEGYIVKSFFKSFKQNFIQATIIWVIIVAFIGIFALDWYIFSTNNSADFSNVMMIALGVLFIIVCMGVVYVFPVLSRFENTVYRTIKNSIFMAILSFPKTILMMACYAIPVILLLLVASSVPVVLMLGISAPAYLTAMIYNGIFKKFEPNVAGAQITADEDFRIEVDENDEDVAENKDIENEDEVVEN